MNPVGPKSWRVTTGTGPAAPGNDSNGWNSDGGRDIRAARTAERPLEHVHYVAPDGDPVADHSVLGRHLPRDERGQGAGGGARGDRGNGPPDTAGQHRGQGGALPELLLPEPIDHQEHNLVGSGYRVRKPSGYRGAVGVGQLAEQGRHDTVQARATPVGKDRIGPVSGLRSPFSGQRHCRLGWLAVGHEGTPYDHASLHPRMGR